MNTRPITQHQHRPRRTGGPAGPRDADRAQVYRRSRGHRPGLVITLAAAGSIVAIAACGSSAHTPGSSAHARPARSSVLAWGANAAGQLGDGTPTQKKGSDVPVKVKLPAGTTVIAIAVGGHHSLAVTSTGQALAWGINLDGELGDGKSGGGVPHLHQLGETTSSDVPVEVKLPAGTKVTAVAGGDAHACSNAPDDGYSLALTSTGQVLAWGYNRYGELGDGSTASSDLPVEVKLPAGRTVSAIAAGGSHSLALTSTGRVLAWGDNAFGELGDGSTASSDVPVDVKLPAGTKVTAIAAGGSHSLALTSTGRVLAWGDNAFGELGDGSTISSDVPVEAKLPAGRTVSAIAAGCSHSLALTSTGQMLGWGHNSSGELGDGSTTSSDVPVKVRLPSRIKVTAIAGGGHQSLAMTSTGQVLAWGDNALGQLGDGSTHSSDTPVKVKLPNRTKATKLGAESVGDYSLALVHQA